jgi:hypothetical protein
MTKNGIKIWEFLESFKLTSWGFNSKSLRHAIGWIKNGNYSPPVALSSRIQKLVENPKQLPYSSSHDEDSLTVAKQPGGWIKKRSRLPFATPHRGSWQALSLETVVDPDTGLRAHYQQIAQPDH